MLSFLPPSIQEKAAQLFSGEVPDKRDTVGDCVLLVLKALLDQYVGSDSTLARELDHLLEALGNYEDPMIKGQVSVMEHKSLVMLLHQLKKARVKNVERINAKAAEESAAAAAGGSEKTGE